MFKKKKKKGFTLVELLAVIVILAVVILIAVTAVIPRMNKAKKNAFIDEALIYLKAAEQAYAFDGNDIGSSCINITDLNDNYVKKSGDNYVGTITTELTNGDYVQTISLTNGKYYLVSSSTNISSDDVKDSMPQGFKSSCGNNNSIVAQCSSGDSSCPVTLPASLDGYSSVDVVHYSGNILETNAQSKTQNGITWTINSDGSVTLEGTSTARTYLYVHGYHKIISKDATLTVSVEGLKDNGAYDVFVNLPYSEDGTLYKGTYGQLTYDHPSKTIQYTADKYVGFYIDCPANVTTNQTIKVMVSGGSSASDFEPYTAPTTHTVILGRTIYGGTVDIVNGVGKGTYKYIDLSTISAWYLENTDNFFSDVIADAKKTTSPLCNSFPSHASFYQQGVDGIWISGTGRLNFTLSSIPHTAEALREYLRNNPVYIVYELATPTDFTFEPVNMSASN